MDLCSTELRFFSFSAGTQKSVSTLHLLQFAVQTAQVFISAAAFYKRDFNLKCLIMSGIHMSFKVTVFINESQRWYSFFSVIVTLNAPINNQFNNHFCLIAFDQQREIVLKDLLKVAVHADLWLLCKSIMATRPSKDALWEPGSSEQGFRACDCGCVECCIHQRRTEMCNFHTCLQDMSTTRKVNCAQAFKELIKIFCHQTVSAATVDLLQQVVWWYIICVSHDYFIM